MHRSYLSFSLVFLALMLALVPFAIAARQWTPNDDITNGIPVAGAVQIQSETIGIGHLRIHISDPKVQMEQVELNKQIWTEVTIDGETRLWQDGKPALPLISRFIRLPNTGNVNLIVTPGDYKEYTNIDVIPQQSTFLKPKGKNLEPADYSYDSETYSENNWYPSEIAGINTPQILRDARVALLGVQPVVYNPVTHTLRVYNSIDVEIIPIGGTGENELIGNRTHPVPSFAGIYSDIIGAGDLVTDALNSTPGQILIICRPAVATIAQQLADWKTQSGHPCQVITTLYTNPQTIHDSLIMPVYNGTGTPLETVLLVGDGGTTTANYEMPAFTWAWTGPYAETVYTDHYYGCINTSTAFTAGILASWWSGRFSATTDAQFQTMVNRTLNYERKPNLGPTGADTAWYNYAWGYAGTAMNIYTNPSCIRYCLQCIRDRGVTNLLYDEHNGNVDPNLINTRLSGGALFWPHRAAWVGEISNANVDGITNTNKPWVGCNVSCYTGEWYGSGSTGIQEEVTRLGTPTSPQGALSSVSTQTDGTNPAHNNVTAAGTFYALTLGARQPGPMYFQAKYQLYRNDAYGEVSSPGIPPEMFILANNPHGDLSVNFWTGVPHALTVNVPTTLAIGQNRMELQVFRAAAPVSGALVTAWKKNAGGTNETYTRGTTDDSGRVVMTLSNVTAGTMIVTVVGNKVGQNYIPLIDTVAVAQTATDLAYNSQNILDDNTGGRIGNSDGVANPGETLDLTPQLINRGSSTATGISGTLVSTDSRVVITNATQTWNNIAASGTAASNAAYRVQLLSGFTDNTLVPLRLDLTTGQGSRSITVPLTVRSIKVNYVSCNTSGAWNPGGSTGLYITVQNAGGLALVTSTTATLTSLTTGVSVTSPSAQFATLPVGSNVSNSGSQWSVTAATSVIPGTQAGFRAVFNNGSVTDTVTFTTTIGTITSTCPTGPDAYGYYAYDNTDVSYTNVVPTYSWVEITPGGGGSGTLLPITDNSSSDAATVVRLPFTVRYYGVNYDSATICDNGWLAFGSQRSPDAAHVPFNFSRNWHLPTHEGPKNLVAVNWCDQTNTNSGEGTYIYNDAVNHRYIVTWKATTVNTPMAQEYQLIVYNPSYYPSATGDAPLKFQYKTFNPAVFSGTESGVSYATVGIQDSTYSRAIEYCYWNVYTPGSAAIPTGTPSSGQRAILFTTSVSDTLLHIVLPNPGDSLAVGSSAIIQWRGRPGLSTVNIDVNRTYPGGAWERIVTAATNNGSTNWTITGPASNTARFRVMSPSGTEGDTTKGNVNIAVPRIVMSSPNGGEVWSGLTSRNISWTSSIVTGTVTIQIDRSYPSGVWENLFSSVANSGTQAWIPSSPSTTTARIRVMSDAIPSAGDTSNANFSIIGPALLGFTPTPLVRSIAPGDSIRQTVNLNNLGDGVLTNGVLTVNTASTGYGYTVSGSPGGPAFSWVDITTTGTNTGLSGDDFAAQVPLGAFTFPYYGATISQATGLYVCTDGQITMGATNTAYANTVLPSASLPATSMAVWWCDMYVTSPEGIYYRNMGDGRFVIEFVMHHINLSTYTVTAEAIIYSDGRILFQYNSVNNISLTDLPTVGIQGATSGSNYVAYAQNVYSTAGTVYPPAGTAILFQASTPFATPSTYSFSSVPAHSNSAFTVLWDAHGRNNGDSLTGTWTFSGDASNSPLTIPVSMKVSNSPVMSLMRSASSIANGSTFAFDTTAVLLNDDIVLTVTNTGGGALNLTGTPHVTTTGNFTVVSQPTTPISTYTGTANFTVRFTPTVIGQRNGTLTIANNDPYRNPYTINLTGYAYATAPAIAVHNGIVNIPNNTGSVSFDTTSFATPVDKVLKILNTGYNILNLTGSPNITATGAFSILSQPASSALVAGDSTTFTVRFTPGTTGVSNGTVSIASNDTTRNPFTFAVTGFVAAPVMVVRNGVTSISNNIATLVFDTTESITPEDIVLTIANTGNQTLSLTGIPIVVTTGNFSVVSPPSTSIPVNGSSNFTIRYTPNGVGASAGTVLIANNDPMRNPYQFNLAGYAIDPVVTVNVGVTNIPNNIGTAVFDTTYLGLTRSVTFSITNTGNYNLDLDQPVFLTGSGNFSITTQPDMTIVPGATSYLTIQCTAVSAGLTTGIVHISSDDPVNSPYQFNLSCFVVQPPSAPTNLTVTLNNNQAVLNWSAATGAVDEYHVYRDFSGYFIPDTLTYFNRVITLPAGTLTWSDPSALTVKYYKVTSFSHFSAVDASTSSFMGSHPGVTIIVSEQSRNAVDGAGTTVSTHRPVRKGVGRVIVSTNSSGDSSQIGLSSVPVGDGKSLIRTGSKGSVVKK